MSTQCDVCGRFCAPYSRIGEHPEYGLQSTFCAVHDSRNAIHTAAEEDTNG